MNPIPRHTKAMQLEYVNLNTKDVCFRITIPLTADRGLKVSDLYKRLKPAIADGENVDVSRITAKHTVIEAKHENNILYEWRGGISLIMPYNADAYDYKIVLAQLEVLKMKFNCPSCSPR